MSSAASVLPAALHPVSPALSLPLLAAAAFAPLAGLAIPASAWEDSGIACTDSASWGGERDFWFEFQREPGVVEDCDPEESLLFSREPAPDRPRESNRAALSFTRTPGAPQTYTVLRHQAARNGWNHRVELRGDTLTRRHLGWSGRGWRLVAGDLTDTAMPLWPRALPRRRLPAGWRGARGALAAVPERASTLPQGIAAGIAQPGWKGYALRARNPVESGKEPPWHDPWDLRHVAAGAAIAPAPGAWTGALHFSETRVSRDDADSLSERLVAAGLASSRRGANLIGMLSDTRRREGIGWLVAVDLRRRFPDEGTRGATVDLTLRQRDGDWASSWDPAWSPAAAERDDADGGWGAGEARIAARLPFREAGRRRNRGFIRGEAWRAWNPAAGSARRGMRGAFEWRHEDARAGLSGTRRVSRAASGSISRYRYLQADTRLESPPRWRATAWRAWNRDGPLREGLFLGAEPAFGSWTLRPGLRLESDRHDRLEGIASLGFRYGRGSGWRLDGYGTVPVWPDTNTESMRWRVTVHYTGR